MDQEKYLEKILDRVGLPLTLSSKPKPRFIPLSGKYEKLENSRDGELRTDKTDYQQKVGSVMIATVCPRPDMAFHIGRLSQQLQGPTERYASEMKELGRYLRTTIQQNLILDDQNARQLGIQKMTQNHGRNCTLMPTRQICKNEKVPRVMSLCFTDDLSDGGERDKD